MIKVTLSGTEAVRAMLERIGHASQAQALKWTAVDVERYVESEADKHTKTGALLQSVYSRKTGPTTYEIGHDLQRAPHALFVHWGTKPHVIKPKKRKVLRWANGGLFVFAKSVRHPGNKPDPWLERAANMAPRIFAQKLETLIRKA